MEFETIISKSLIIDVGRDGQKYLNPNDDCKILVIKDCDSLQKLFEILNEESFKSFLKHSSHCFMIVANIQKVGKLYPDVFQNKFNNNNFGDRPLIIEILDERAKGFKIYAKKCGESQLQEVNFVKINEDQQINSLSFDFLLKNLKLKDFGEFSGELLKSKINFTKKFNGKSLIQHAVESGDTLVVRFLKLFLNETPEEILKMSAKRSRPEVLAAFLDLPIDDDGKAINIDAQLMASFASQTEVTENLLCIAAAHGAPKMVEFILRLNIWNQNFEVALKASNAAFRENKFENLWMLLKNDFPFPSEFDEIQISTDNEIVTNIKNFHDKMTKFHAAIEANYSSSVENFILENPDLKNCYGPNNKTALRVALDNTFSTNNFDAFARLLYHRFTSFGDDEYQEIFNQLKPEIREGITKACTKFYGKPVDSHIFFIYSKTRLGFGYDKEQQKNYFEEIKNYLDELNEIKSIIPILKVIEHSYSLVIVFDFDHDNVSKTDLNSDRSTLGVCYFKTGRLYIGAKSSNKETLGTLIHELTHYAMQIVFKNDGKPFAAADIANREFFNAVVAKCRAMESHNSIVLPVFNSSCYDESFQSAELIVRVPEMMAFYHYDDESSLKAELKKYEKLADFYTNQVLGKIESFVKDPNRFQAVRDVQQLNDRLGNINELSNIKLKPFEPVTDAIKSSIQVIISEIPTFTIASLFQQMEEDQFVVLSMRDLRNRSNIGNVISSCMLINDLIIIINMENMHKLTEDLKELLKRIGEFKSIIFICEEKRIVDELSDLLGNVHVHSELISYNWDDIDDEMKSKLLKTEVKFQGHKVELMNIVKSDSEAAKSYPVAQLVSGTLKEIARPINKNNGYDLKYFIDRTFINEKFSKAAMSFENFLNTTLDKNIVLIDGEAGMGKSTILTHAAMKLKEKFKHHWILRVDLHKKSEALKSESNQADVVSLLIDHFGENKNEFEKILMRDFLDSGKIILMLDGVDEISPLLTDIFERIMVKFQAMTFKQIWLTTRPHLVADMQKKYKTTSWQMNMFERDTQINFLVKYWKSKLKDESFGEVDDKLKSFATSLAEFMSQSTKDKLFQIIEIPLQAEMFADIFLDEVEKKLASEILKFEAPENFNMLWLYDKFMRRKIKIINSEKGELVQEKKAENELQAIHYLEDHEKLAIQLLFPNKSPDISHLNQINNDDDFSQLNIDEELLEIKISNDDLQLYGIVNVDSNQRRYFSHRTFAEYFASRFIFKIISKPTYSPIPEAVKLLVRLGTEIPDRMIEIFLESALEKSPKINCNEKILKSVAESIENKLKLRNFDFLDKFISFGLNNIAVFLLNAMIYCSRNQIFNMLKHLETCPKLDWNVTVRIRGLPESMLNLVKKLDLNDVRAYLKQKQRGRNILEICFCEFPTNEKQLQRECFSSYELNNPKIEEITFGIYNQRSYVTKIFDFATEIYDRDVQKRLLNVLEDRKHKLNVFCMSADFAKTHLQMILSHRWKILKELFFEDDQKNLTKRQKIMTNFIKMLLSVNCRTDSNSHDDNFLVETFKWFEETFSEAELKILINDSLMSTLKNIKNFKTAQKLVPFARLHDNLMLLGK